jgi:hypothetical protein
MLVSVFKKMQMHTHKHTHTHTHTRQYGGPTHTLTQTHVCDMYVAGGRLFCFGTHTTTLTHRLNTVHILGQSRVVVVSALLQLASVYECL